MSDLEERIRRRAYQLWEAEGRPEGRAQAHWARACAQVAVEVESERRGDAGDRVVGRAAAEASPPAARPSAQEEPVAGESVGKAPARRGAPAKGKRADDAAPATKAAAARTSAAKTKASADKKSRTGKPKA